MNEDEFENLRSAKEIAHRSLVLFCIVATAKGVSRRDVSDWLKQENLWNDLTPCELKFIQEDNISEKERIRMTWFAESLVPLFWAIEKMEEMQSPDDYCNTKELTTIMPPLFDSTREFIQTAVLRDKQLIEQEYELIYDFHCEVAKAIRNGNKNLKKYVPFYRHYAFNWIICYCNQDWDEITPDI